MFRIGWGYDLHPLVEGRPLILGGIEIPFYKGLWGHSDADVLTHAIMDAMLGALALGDLGVHFPEDREEFKGASSISLLSRVTKMIGDCGYCTVNLDCTVIAEKPRLQNYIFEIRQQLCGILEAPLNRISVKSTTNEGIDGLGAGEGVAAHAVILLQEINS